MKEISIPFQDERDRLHLGEIHDLVHEAISDPTEQRVTRELMFDLATTPVSTPTLLCMERSALDLRTLSPRRLRRTTA